VSIAQQLSFDKSFFSSYNTDGKKVRFLPEREICCCFTGHRPAKLPWGYRETDPRCIELKLEIVQRVTELYERGWRRFICGMAEGCDMYFADAVIALREIRPDVSLEAAIPCGSQSEHWVKAQRERYNQLIDRCDRVTVLQIHYSPDCMQRRNHYMVDRSSLLLACYDGKPGGTMSTILYAQRQGLAVETISLP
jgi:uncharacterized phage-like protein YoqJ